MHPRLLPLFPLSMVLLACGEQSKQDSENSPVNVEEPNGDSEAKDYDGDGFGADVDCDDENPDVHPDALEICDGIDNDCDEQIDDEDDSIDVTSMNLGYTDVDGDGEGDPESSVTACVLPDGLVDNGDDCDDSNPTVFSDAEELCDGLINQCGSEALPDNEADNDGDGYVECAFDESTWQGDINVLGGGDCDDASASAHPNAVEVCDDGGLDEDCDGMANDDDDNVDLSTGQTFYADSDLDGEGDASSPLQACEAPEGYVANMTDCDDGDGALNNADNDQDGFTTCPDSNGFIDCDDAGTSGLTNSSLDADCDSVLDADDCDANDPLFGAIAQDMDCDGATTVDDCDDMDELSTIVADDLDCDGVLSVDDCNESVSDSDGDGVLDGLMYGDMSLDMDCDGILTADDCDDADNASTAISLDADCDGSLTVDDCDDADPFTYPGAAYLTSTTECLTDVDGDGYAPENTPCFVFNMPHVAPGAQQGTYHLWINGVEIQNLVNPTTFCFELGDSIEITTSNFNTHSNLDEYMHIHDTLGNMYGYGYVYNFPYYWAMEFITRTFSNPDPDSWTPSTNLVNGYAHNGSTPPNTISMFTRTASDMNPYFTGPGGDDCDDNDATINAVAGNCP